MLFIQILQSYYRVSAFFFSPALYINTIMRGIVYRILSNHPLSGMSDSQIKIRHSWLCLLRLIIFLFGFLYKSDLRISCFRNNHKINRIKPFPNWKKRGYVPLYLPD